MATAKQPKPDKDGKYTSTAAGQTFYAFREGFYDGGRVRVGETFPVNEKGEKFAWAYPASEGQVTADLGGRPALLEKKPAEIVKSLSGLTNTQLNGTLSAEQAGKNRKAIIRAIEDELANRVGEIGGPPPAKQPEEKDQTIPGGGGEPPVDPLS